MKTSNLASEKPVGFLISLYSDFCRCLVQALILVFSYINETAGIGSGMRNLGVIILFLGLASGVRAESIISGVDYRIVDGDTVHIGANKIRLIGIDAPERKQHCQTRAGAAWPCGMIARDMLAGMVATRAGLTCVISGKDRYNRLLGTCYAGVGSSPGGEAVGGFDLQQALVRAGLAVAEYGDTYHDDETVARSRGRGIWAGCFTRPKDWRRKKRDCN